MNTLEDRGGEALDRLAHTNGVRWPEALDLAEMATRQPPKPAFVIADWLPIGYATLLAGHGGVGKSALGLHLAVCIAMGLSYFGMPCEPRRVLYLSCEDRAGLLHWRLAHICAYLGLNMAELAGKLDLVDLVGVESVLWARDPRTGHCVTSAFNQLAERIERDHPGIVIVDGVSDTFGGNENARTEVKAYVNALLAALPPDAALLLLGHVAKPAATNSATSEGYSGSTQWHNAVRARWYLYPETEMDESGKALRSGRLVLELQKSNLGPIDQSLTFEWDDEVRLFVATGSSNTGRINRAERDQTEQFAIAQALGGCGTLSLVVPAAVRGQRTAFNVLAMRPEFPESLKRSSRRFWTHVEHLRQIGWITETEYRRADRKRGVQLTLTSQALRRIGDIKP